MNSKNVILIEDNPDDIALVQRVVRKSGLEINLTVAGDGYDAIQSLFDGRKHPWPQPALILLDLRMSRMDGFEVLTRLRKEAATRLVPVVVFTSSNEDSDIRRSLELGANSFVQKSVNYAELAEAIRSVLVYWLQINQPATTLPTLRTTQARRP